jgi:hypothetical protein
VADIVDKIMAKFESDPTIRAKSLNLVIASKGFLKPTFRRLEAGYLPPLCDAGTVNQDQPRNV